MIQYQKQNQMFVSTLISKPEITSGFATRAGGDGRQSQNALSYLRINQVLFKKMLVLEQIHSANIIYFEGGNKSEIEALPETDGVITDDVGVVLTVRTADCLPVTYLDTKENRIGISHNGRRGTFKRLGQKMILKMVEKGSAIEDIRIAIGPGIGACCYDVDEEIHTEFMEEFGTDFASFPIKGGRRHINLLKLNVALFSQVGIPQEHIDFFPFCTMCQKDLFYSFRRDYKKHPDKFGEMLSFIVKTQYA